MVRYLIKEGLKESILSRYLFSRGYELVKFFDGRYQILKRIDTNKFRPCSIPLDDLREVKNFIKRAGI